MEFLEYVYELFKNILYYIYIIFSALAFYYISDNNLKKTLNSNAIYTKMNNTSKRFHLWIKDASILEIVSGMKMRLEKLSLILVILIIISAYTKLDSLLNLFLIILAINLYFSYSYSWIAEHNKHLKNTFFPMGKILIVASILGIILLEVLYNSNQANFELPFQFSESIDALRTFQILFFAIICLILISTYLGIWLFSLPPILLLLIFFIFCKLDTKFSFTKSNTFLLLIYGNGLFLSIKSLL